MPLYEYACADHGEFELARSMQESAQGAPCPWCQQTAPRILSAPTLRHLPKNTRVALERNEQSSHEPKLVRKPSPLSADAVPKPSLRAGGGRPWVLEHG